MKKNKQPIEMSIQEKCENVIKVLQLFLNHCDEGRNSFQTLLNYYELEHGEVDYCKVRFTVVINRGDKSVAQIFDAGFYPDDKDEVIAFDFYDLVTHPHLQKHEDTVVDNDPGDGHGYMA